MKKHPARASRLHSSDWARRREIPQEIKDYLNAVVSYPQRFAQEPGISFEQHFCSVASRPENAAGLHQE